MQQRTIHGVWALPVGQADHEALASHGVPGTLDVGPEGIALSLSGFLQEHYRVFAGSLDVVTHDRVVGRSHDGELVTVLRATERGLSRRGDQPAQRLSGWSVTTGDAFAPSELVSRLWFEVDLLTPWVAGSLARRRHGGAALELDLRTEEIGHADVHGHRLTLTRRWAGAVRSDSVDLRDTCNVRIDMSGQLDLVKALELVRPLQDLLVLVLGRPARLTDLKIEPAESDGEFPAMLDCFIPITQVSAGRPTSSAELGSYWSSTLASFDEAFRADFAGVIAKWFQLHQELQPAITAAISPWYRDGMYSDHRFASAVQAAEAYAGIRFGEQERSSSSHRDRVNRVLTALEESDLTEDERSWTRGVLSNANRRPMRKQLEQVVDRTGLLGEAIRSVVPQFEKEVNELRRRTHHGGRRDGLGGPALFWYGEAMRVVVRVAILMDLGLADHDLISKAQKWGVLPASLSGIADLKGNRDAGLL